MKFFWWRKPYFMVCWDCGMEFYERTREKAFAVRETHIVQSHPSSDYFRYAK